ncbi:alpha/beta hydrolase [Actinotalea subterranea]|uniref:alpha/beta hydrolase n=1 Tax=Actinotalea subterranea TaxID=2607497 RepID=UPI00165D6635|nr:alpha/beta hydrolase [Actinotalea subterranea]
MTLRNAAPLPAPPFDSESAAALALTVGTPSPLTADDIGERRRVEAGDAAAMTRHIEELGLVRVDEEIPVADGATITLSLVHRRDRIPTSPLIYYMHGGGMILGNRWSGADVFLEWIERYNAVVATVEYRLAPEHRFPVPQQDCYAGLRWLEDNAGRLGLTLETALLAGISAGGGLAASVAQMVRDANGPRLAGQLLLAPMLDDRVTRSARQFPSGIWNSTENELGWRSLLGDLYGSDDVPAYAAPARAERFDNLPPAFIEVGSAEVFRDEAVAYASDIWAAGGQAELHVWAGAFHGFQLFEHTTLARGARDAVRNWLDRALGYSGRD